MSGYDKGVTCTKCQYRQKHKHIKVMNSVTEESLQIWSSNHLMSHAPMSDYPQLSRSRRTIHYTIEYSLGMSVWYKWPVTCLSQQPCEQAFAHTNVILSIEVWQNVHNSYAYKRWYMSCSDISTTKGCCLVTVP